MRKSHIFTFYSYKGGSGRSTTLANTALHLAKALNASKDRPILIVDADLESAGLTYLFNCENRFHNGDNSTDTFSGTIHTEKLLNLDPDQYFGMPAGKCFLSISSGNKETVDCSVISKKYTTALKQLVAEDAPELLADIPLEKQDSRNFETIIDAWVALIDDELSEWQKMIHRCFDYDALFAKLRSIMNGSGSAEDKLRKRTAAVCDMLPAREPVDISNYFGLEAGSVRFLGVNVRSLGAKTDPDADIMIPRMAAELGRASKGRENSKPQYQAILFDSASGTQSTADTLHQVSDLLVYCMRPTQQFISGTELQLLQYEKSLQAIAAQNPSGKAVILLPTAVPRGDHAIRIMCENSFSRINKMINGSSSNSQVVDNAFCSQEESLGEVALFKWYEHILGTKDILGNMPQELAMVYEAPASMPEDAKNAYCAYQRLATRMLENIAASANQ